MKTRQEKIDAIYEKIARKDLSFWCKFRVKNEMSFWAVIYLKWFEFSLIKSRKDEKIVFAWESFSWPLYFTNFEFENLKIIGHSVMIWDVLDYYWDKKWAMTLDRILRFWEEKTKPIEDQSDECVDYIYNLIS